MRDRLTRHLPGEVTGVDQSPAMIDLARERCPEATFAVADAFDLPFGERSFDLVVTSYVAA